MSVRCAASVLLAIVLCAATQADEFSLSNPVLIADAASDPDHNAYYWPDWSVDGRIVFEAEITGATNGCFELITTDTAGGSQQLIPYDWEAGYGWGIPRFSRDGSKIMGHITGQFGYGFLMNADGSEAQLLDPGPPSPNWYSAFIAPGASLDSALITDGEIVMRVNLETEEIAWSSPLLTNAWGADWSPDGTGFVWADRSEYLMFGDASTGPDCVPDSIDVGHAAEFPSWSATRDLILFRSGRRTYVVRSDGTGLSELLYTPIAGDMGTARWSPDGQSIVYSVEGKIYRADVVPEPGMMLGMLMLAVVGSRRR